MVRTDQRGPSNVVPVPPAWPNGQCQSARYGLDLPCCTASTKVGRHQASQIRTDAETGCLLVATCSDEPLRLSYSCKPILARRVTHSKHTRLRKGEPRDTVCLRTGGVHVRATVLVSAGTAS